MSIRFRNPAGHTRLKIVAKRTLGPQYFKQNMAAIHAGKTPLIETDMRQIMREESYATQRCPMVELDIRTPTYHKGEATLAARWEKLLLPWTSSSQAPTNRDRWRFQGVSFFLAGCPVFNRDGRGGPGRSGSNDPSSSCRAPHPCGACGSSDSPLGTRQDRMPATNFDGRIDRLPHRPNGLARCGRAGHGTSSRSGPRCF